MSEKSTAGPWHCANGGALLQVHDMIEQWRELCGVQG